MNKLDIEFEDDEEIKAREEAERKKNQVVEEVDIDFGVDDSAPASSGESKPTPKAEKAAPSEQQQKVKPIEKAQRPQEHTSTPQQQKPEPAQVPTQQYQQIPQAQVMIGPDYKLGDELKKFAASNQIFAIELEARVKVEVTKEMTKTVADFHAQNKLLEHKINKLLMQMNQKAPAIKNELMMIKKLLKEHCSLDEEGAEENAAPTKSDGARPTKRPVKKKAA